MAEESANIYRVNKLLEIEAADWEQQLKRAVSYYFGFYFPMKQTAEFIGMPISNFY